MRKMVILLATVLLLCIFAGCTHSGNMRKDDDTGKIVHYPAAVTEEKIQKIEKAYEAKFKKEFKLRWNSENDPDGEAFYCGSENGYDIIVFVPGGNGSLSMSGGVSVYIGGDVEFPNMNAQSSLYAYNDGDFIKLSDAYEEGLITKEGLEEAAENYKSALDMRTEFHGVNESLSEDPELDKAIIKAYCGLINKDETYEKEFHVRHYVQIEDLYAVYIDGPMDYTQAFRTVLLFNKYNFIFPTGQKMYLYRDGEICALDDAETLEFATLKEIQSLWVHYNEKDNSRYQNGYGSATE